MESVALEKLEDAERYLRDLDLTSEWKDEVEASILKHLRFLRGTCVNSRTNQNVVLFKICLSFRHHEFHNFSNANMGAFVRRKGVVCGTQFLGNFVAGNLDSQYLVWSLVYPSVLRQLLSLLDAKISEITSMIIYNCLQSSEVNCESFVKNINDGDSGAVFLLCENLTVVNDQDWIMLCINQHLIHVELFLPNVFEYGSYNCRCNVLDVLSQSCENMPNYVIKFMTDQFIIQSEGIDNKEKFTNTDEVLVTVKVLEVLCAVTSKDGSIRNLFSATNLLPTIIDVLRKVTVAGKIDTQGAFGLAQNRSPSVGALETAENPVAGFKRNLIRVIGNLCYHNQHNQNKIRELGGIELILQHFDLDDNNPFIQQWSVLAVRNLCENNLENQEIVARYERLAAAESPILRRAGVAVELSGDFNSNRRSAT